MTRASTRNAWRLAAACLLAGAVLGGCGPGGQRGLDVDSDADLRRAIDTVDALRAEGVITTVQRDLLMVRILRAARAQNVRSDAPAGEIIDRRVQAMATELRGYRAKTLRGELSAEGARTRTARRVEAFAPLP